MGCDINFLKFEDFDRVRQILRGWDTEPNDLFQAIECAASISRRIALGPERSVMPLSLGLAASFKAWSASFLAPFRSHERLVDSPYWASAVRERTLALLYEALRENENVGSGTHPLNHVQGWNLTSCALNYIDGRPHQRLSVSDISKNLGCTTRALEYAFKTTLGVKPVQYLLARRLHLARRELLAIRKGLPSVTKAAADQGFTHFGRFSQYYRWLFGELPSDTLRRRAVAVSQRNGNL